MRQELNYLSERQEIFRGMVEDKIRMWSRATEKYYDQIFEEMKELEEKKSKDRKSTKYALRTSRGARVKVFLLILTDFGLGVQSVTLIWDSGGRVDSLRLRDGARGVVREVLVDNGEDANAVRTNSNHYSSCLRAPWANRVANGTNRFPLGAEPPHFLLHNEITDDRQDAIHGFLCNKSLEYLGSGVTASSPNAQYAWQRLGHTFQDEVGYPWRVRVEVEYRLRSSSRGITFEFETVATNLETTCAPWTHSWHPYFAVIDVVASSVIFDSRVSWAHVTMRPPRFGDLIPTGERTPFGTLDPIGRDGRNTSASRYRRECWSRSLGDKYAVWQVFTSAEELWGSSSVVVEPMSGLADAFNNGVGLTVLSAGDTWSGTIGVYDQSLNVV